MTFLADETSVASSRPVELYAFVTPSATYRYTSGPIAVVFGGFTFDPLPGLKRSTIAGSSSNDPPEFSIEMPYDAALVQAEAFVMPSKYCTCTITRVQPGGADTIWVGEVAAYEVEKRTAKLRVPSKMDDALASTVPGVSFQYLCNHQLYGPMCGVDETDPAFRATTTLTSYDLGRTYTVASIAGKPDDWYTGGKVTRIADGEPRLIEKQTGTTIKLSAPFRSWSPGSTVFLNAGCGHDIFDCRDKYNNAANYGGFTGIPNLNPLANLRGLL